MIKRIAAVLSVLFLSHAAFAAVVSDADIRAILVDRIDVQHQGVGIVVGVIDPADGASSRTARLRRTESRVDGDTRLRNRLR